MRKMIIPITMCHVNCPKCSMPVDFKMFESGPGGDFETYFETEKMEYYRLDLSMAYYLKKDVETILKQIIDFELKPRTIVKIPDQLKCTFCNSELDISCIRTDGEEKIEAFILE